MREVDYKVTNEDLWGMLANIFRDFPIIESLETHEGSGASVSLKLKEKSPRQAVVINVRYDDRR